MRIIEKIEINYFRSIYSINLNKVNHLNLFIGQNDVGKSNIVKALNLFFNNQTELQNQVNFIEDLSRTREVEARAAKGRATIWIKVFFNNFLGWRSLPDKFTVKKTWNRYESQPTINVQANEEVAPTTLAKFLNKITFHYIPPIRGQEVFTHYLSLLHDALIEDERAGIKEASTRLITKINESTDEMSERIKDQLGFQSTVEVPQDLRDLFKALNFSTKFSSHDIPLQRRGDGIQARHIPFILDFVANHSSKHHIWAYEEPENSLEMGRAFELAQQFESDFSRDNQIFVTSHSPAFYDLCSDQTSKWLVQQEERMEEEYVTTALPFESSELADTSVGIVALISDRAKEIKDQMVSLEIANQKLQEVIATKERPQVIVEGKTDCTILESAYKKLFNEEAPFDFIDGNGASNISNFLKYRACLSYPSTNVPIIGLFDNDHEGLKRYSQIRGVDMLDLPLPSKKLITNGNSRLYAALLPKPEEINNAIQNLQNAEKGMINIPFVIEHMFPKHVLDKAIEEKTLKLTSKQHRIDNAGFQFPIDITEYLGNKLPVEFNHLAYAIAEESKSSFSEWVCDLDTEEFEQFNDLFAGLKSLLE